MVRAVALLASGVLLCLLAALPVPPWSAYATPSPAPTPPQDVGVELILFWGDGCPHCEAEQQWLEEVREEYPRLVVTQREVWYDEANRQLLFDTAADLGFDATGVPTTVIGEQYWVGFSDTIAAEIEEALDAEGARDTRPAPSAPTDPPESRPAGSTTIDVPILGPVTLDLRRWWSRRS